ncbi:ATP-dependent bile acid permease [Termitomyces sp. J132]|nr:ATP-dependent bile acid permease [Termitomyces sp. J132]
MLWRLCGTDSHPLDFDEPCVRSAWAALVPFGVVLVVFFVFLGLRLRITKMLRTFVTLEEAEALVPTAENGNDNGNGVSNDSEPTKPTPTRCWKPFFFVSIGLASTLTYLTHFSYLVITSSLPLALPSLLLALSWLYTVLRPALKPTQTVPYDLFAVYTAFFAGAVLHLGGVYYDRGVFGLPWPGVSTMLALWGNLIVTTAMVSVVLGMPLALPGENVKAKDIGATVSPEDYTSLFGWITFFWVYPLVQRGRYTTLDEKSVWNLSPTMQSRIIFSKFAATPAVSLFRKLIVTNSLDLFLDLTLTLVSVGFNYTGPFFLKRILDAIDLTTPTPSSRAQAYIYALLAFLCSLLKSQADVQHLWFGRRAGTRIRSELMAGIYDKTLKRRDFSGVIDKNKKEKMNEEGGKNEGMGGKNGKGKGGKKDDENEPKAGADVGKIVNLMASDANRIAMTVSAMYFVYGAPLEIIIASIFLYQLLGLSAFAGFLVLLLGWPLNSYIARRSVRIQKGWLAARDRRMGVLSELVGAVKFVKFFAWEERWVQRVMGMRGVEIAWMVKARINSVAFSLLWTSAPILISIISFFVYVIQGNELSISTAFTAIALFNMVRAPLNVIPTWIVQILQARFSLPPFPLTRNTNTYTLQTGVALNRIAVYLNEDEVDEQVSSLKKDASSPSPPASAREIEVDVDHKFELRDIDVKFPEGELTLITGPTASGKTALLMALLGEMTLLPSIPPGRILMSKTSTQHDGNGHTLTISYASQSPWLRHQSIRENILFGSPFDPVRYAAVIDACALRPDLDVLEDGDMTEIGARGVSLSGGQKARVALARAVYDRARWVLLDDPLSAVDSGTAGWIVEKLLKGELLNGRTVILVTHHVDLVLPAAHYLVRMLDGRIDTQGTVQDLRAQGVLEDIKHDSTVSAAEAEAETKEQEALAGTPESEEIQELEEGESGNGGVGGETQKEKKKPRKLVKDEHREVGGVKWAIYKSYLKASSYWIWVFLAVLVVVSQLLGVGEKVWIMIWGEAYKNTTTPSLYTFTSFTTKASHDFHVDGYHPSQFRTASSTLYFPSVQSIRTVFIKETGRFGINWPRALAHPLFYIGVYAGIGLLNVLVGMASMVAQYTGLHSGSMIRPRKGGLQDVETIDSSLAGSLQAVNTSLANFFASILLVATVFPWFLVPAIFLGFAYRELSIGYLNTGRDLRRMESNSRSPIFSDFGELLEGIVTVRAFSAERRFLDNLHKKIDLTTKMWYSFWMTNRWLLLNFDALGALAVLITMLFSISMLAGGAGLAGICITSSMAFTTSVYWACRFWTALELDLNSVERVVEYLDLPQEPPAIIESNRPPAYWPSSSNNSSLIVVEDLEIKYAPDLPAVLQNVSFTLKAGERVGLLGRTGSGKSTLAMSILRFVDPTSGRISIDGIDISTIGVHDLRSRLTFIPQDATLFSGTLRENLDPFNEHTDAECLDVLQRCHMISTPSASRSASYTASPSTSRPASIHRLEREDLAESISISATDVETKTTVTLETQVSAGGTNFSQGQRQLIAMARALLRRSSIIVLDEATSSIDFATDAKIQTTIREEFTSSLLVTIAHRLRTVIDYDRLIVLDKGQIVEFDTPWNLIQKEGGIFRSMCLKSGSFGDLEAVAKGKAEHIGLL